MLCRRLVPLVTGGAVALGLLPLSAGAASAPSLRAASTPSLSSPAVAAAAAARPTTVVRVATFNVRTARARSDKRNWLTRAPDVAREILSRNPGVVALQELGPGRADGVKGKIGNHIRQTTSLTQNLGRLGGRRYQLVRWTAYVAPGTSHGTQGARILYDTTRYRLLSSCPETTGKKMYNRACGSDLPIAAGDSSNQRRSAAFARFRSRRTGRAFWVVSAHLDNRHSATGYALKARQAAYIASYVARRNPSHLPVVFGGDINSWSTDRSRYAPHRALVARGYRDAIAARVRIKAGYTTVNHWAVRLKQTSKVRLDVVMVRGGRGFRRYENVARVVDRARPSDHNMVVADIVL